MRAFSGLALCVLLVGCGSGNSGSSLLSRAADGVMLVVLGGNTSCKTDAQGTQGPRGMDMYEPFQALSDRLARDGGADVSYFLACHNSDAAVHYVTSDDPDRMQTVTIAQFPSKLEQLGQNHEASQVYVAGHSYGGWLAMKAGLVLADEFEVTGLYTIDPISRENCSFSRPSGCTQAPSDITTAQRNMLSDRTEHWLNFYQTQTFYLHSSAMSQADANLLVQTSHTGIDTHPNVWARVTDEIERRFY